MLSAQRRLIKTDKTERFTTALEAESQGCKNFLNTIVSQPVTLGTTLFTSSFVYENREYVT